MDEEKNYPEYQWSIFIGQDRKEQIVVRKQSLNELLIDRNLVMKKIADSQPKDEYVPEENVQCDEHNVTMKMATSKKTGKPYWYHRSEGGQMCFGRGYK